MHSCLVVACHCVVAAATAAAQDAQRPAAATGAQEPAAPQAAPSTYSYEGAHVGMRDDGDFHEINVLGGFRFRWPAQGLEILGRNMLLLSDRETVHDLLQRRDQDGPPVRGIAPPDPRRQLSPDALQERVDHLLRALGQTPTPPTPGQPSAVDTLRLLYFEGDVLVFRRGLEVVRCRRLWISPVDDRIVVEGFELRFPTRAAGGGEQIVVVRGEHIEKQGIRWTGRDLSVTTCEAGEPHYDVQSGEIEIVERDGQFEIRSRGNELRIGGNGLMPLPDAHFFTGEQSAIPLRGASASYSAKEGARARIEVGMPFQGVGGSLHEWLTGRPAEEFRGDWELDLGWIEQRGFPLEAGLRYRAADLYRGSTDFFWLDDDGVNLREIANNLDGSPIDDRNRLLVRSENRVALGADTTLDLVAFHAGDGAVYSEFFRGDYRDKELPETDVYLHHAVDNVLVTLGGRFQLDEFSYRDNRALAPFFVEELPVATVHWLAQPIATLPWGTPLVVDAATEVGQRRRAFDDRFPGPQPSDRTFRADQEVELSAPFDLGPVQVRPFADGRITWYDHDATGDEADRIAFTAGVSAGTRMSRVFSWLDDAGERHALRHVMAPLVTFTDRFRVDGDPARFRQFDATDALTERTLVRVELRNLLQDMQAATGEQPAAVHDLVFLDLAQDLWPDADRDNGGDQLGLFYYDFLVKPRPAWLMPGLAFGVYGDHDWQRGLRTFDAEVRLDRALGVDWTFDYRRDAVVDGAAGIGVHSALLGRWDVFGNLVYDFQREDFIGYGFGLRRNDHDWSLQCAMHYDPFDDQVTVRLEFEPHFGGRPSLRPHNRFGDASGGDNSLLRP